MNHDYPVIGFDVLEIAGGSVCAMAAIRAKEMNSDQKIVLISVYIIWESVKEQHYRAVRGSVLKIGDTEFR